VARFSALVPLALAVRNMDTVAIQQNIVKADASRPLVGVYSLHARLIVPHARLALQQQRLPVIRLKRIAQLACQSPRLVVDVAKISPIVREHNAVVCGTIVESP
jgi:hypothetical protein